MAKKTESSIEAPKVRRTAERRTTRRSAESPAQAPDKGGVSIRTRRPAGSAMHDPTAAQVEHLAYEIYLERGGGHGRDVEDWLEAERRLRG